MVRRIQFWWANLSRLWNFFKTKWIQRLCNHAKYLAASPDRDLGILDIVDCVSRLDSALLRDAPRYQNRWVKTHARTRARTHTALCFHLDPAPTASCQCGWWRVRPQRRQLLWGLKEQSGSFFFFVLAAQTSGEFPGLMKRRQKKERKKRAARFCGRLSAKGRSPLRDHAMKPCSVTSVHPTSSAPPASLLRPLIHLHFQM